MGDKVDQGGPCLGLAGQLSQADKERLGLEGGNLERGGLVKSL